MKTVKKYREMIIKELKKQKKANDLEIIKAHTMFGSARVKSKGSGNLSKVDVGRGIARRIKKENARILTVINERRK